MNEQVQFADRLEFGRWLEENYDKSGGDASYLKMEVGTGAVISVWLQISFRSTERTGSFLRG